MALEDRYWLPEFLTSFRSLVRHSSILSKHVGLARHSRVSILAQERLLAVDEVQVLLKFL